MAQATHGTPPEQAFAQGDLHSAGLFGRNFARVLVGHCVQRPAA